VCDLPRFVEAVPPSKKKLTDGDKKKPMQFNRAVVLCTCRIARHDSCTPSILTLLGLLLNQGADVSVANIDDQRPVDLIPTNKMSEFLNRHKGDDWSQRLLLSLATGA
jgi:hypothetical protein